MERFVDLIFQVLDALFYSTLVLFFVTGLLALLGTVGPILPVACFFVASAIGMARLAVDPLRDLAEAVDSAVRKFFRKNR